MPIPKKKPAKKKPRSAGEKIKEVNTETQDVAEPKKKVKVAEPFSDGLVSRRLKGITVIPRTGDEEVDLLRSFLQNSFYNTPFIGNIASKMSFMKKKGGRLL